MAVRYLPRYGKLEIILEGAAGQFITIILGFMLLSNALPATNITLGVEGIAIVFWLLRLK